MKTLYLIRHGKASLEGTESGRVLMDEGIAQAKQLSGILENLTPAISYLFSSPFVRAKQTLEPIAEKLNLSVHVVEDLRERKLSDGPIEDLALERQKMWKDLSYKLPGGESGIDCQKRAGKALREVQDTMDDNSAAAVVSHGNLIGLILNSYDPSFGYNEWKNMAMPDIFRISFEGEKATVSHIGCAGIKTFKVG